MLERDAMPHGDEAGEVLESPPSARQRSRSLVRFMDAWVGDTLLARARNLERGSGLGQLFLKFEGGNPTGTQKDRVACAQAFDALLHDRAVITAATCGNYGVALARAAAEAGLGCVVYVPGSHCSRRLAELEQQGTQVVRTPGGYEEAVMISRRRAAEEGLYDANPGGGNTRIQLLAYAEIAAEIVEELRDAPAAVALPVSNGTTLAGIHQGFVELYDAGKTSRIPWFVAGSAFHKNPIVRSFCRGARRCEDLPPEAIRETPVNEPLVNRHSLDDDCALDALHATTGRAAHASDHAMRALSRLLRRQEGLDALPAATAGLHALLTCHQREPLPRDRYVAVITGRRQ